MKRSELIEKYYKLLHIKNYAPQTEKSYLHHLTLFLDYIKSAQIKEVKSKVLLDYFNKHLSTTQIYTHINPVSIKKIKSPFDSL